MVHFADTDTAPRATNVKINLAGVSPERFESCLPLVRRAVNALARQLPPQVELDDLYSVGVIGLLKAFQRFDSTLGTSFEAYANTRIRGAMLDELRRLDHLPRTSRSKCRELRRVTEELEQKLGREPSEEELRAKLGLDVRAFRRLKRQTREVSLLSLDCPTSNNEGDSCNLHEAIADEQQQPGFAGIEQNEITAQVVEAMQSLPERQREVLRLSYYEDCKLSDIASRFGVSEARICQIRNQALGTLRQKMQTAAA
ncbi:MAG: RNA polymerase sigma factor for flagellar operon FliA [Puniceicoccaceae bacterium 5H]|nr:MAG: RNA polymerase sigma factor for flagellar operon FliA [Puniceicoccaceae bacterium 5H]